MVEIAVKYIGSVTGARGITGVADRVCRGVVIDSREVEPDRIFVCFPGERVDGNDYASAAIEAGAAAVVMTREPDRALVRLADDHEAAIFVVDEPEEFLLRLAQGYRARMGCTVVGVTGSIGKTTTKDILARALSARYRVHATRGNFNSLIGMPLTILAAPKDTQVMVLEMGMNAPGEIARLTRCAQPTFAVITKIGTSHVGMLGGRENIARAKAEIIQGMPASSVNFEGHHSVLVLDGEDDFTPFIIENFARPAGVEVLLAGMSADDDVSARNVTFDEAGLASFDIMLENGSSFATGLSVPGAPAVRNALFAAAVAGRMGIPQYELDQAFHDLAITARRQQVVDAACGARVIDDSYNASPESMAAGLDLLATLPAAGDRVAVLGEMGELGDEGARLHALVGSYAAAKKLDLLVCVGGGNAREMAAAARLMGMAPDAVVEVESAERALKRFGAAFGAGDLVLVKGSHAVGLDRFAEGVVGDAR